MAADTNAAPMAEGAQNSAKPAEPAVVDIKAAKLPDIKELLKAGVQFGHETKRWNPRMASFIFGAKNNIHIIDIAKTLEYLGKATDSLQKLAKKGPVLFVGTKRQASDLVKKYAIESGSYYVVDRWVGGYFTNFGQVRKSLRRLNELETMFDNGVEGRTKYEVSKMKTEWQKLNRLYQGVKGMDKWPAAVVVIDPKFERGVVKECRMAHIPVFALTDSNCDPTVIDYVIPGNDDALRSIELVLQTLAEAVKLNNQGHKVAHAEKDYSKSDVKIIKPVSTEDSLPVVEEISKPITAEVEAAKPTETNKGKQSKPAASQEESKSSKAKPKKASSEDLEGGILGRARTQK